MLITTAKLSLLGLCFAWGVILFRKGLRGVRVVIGAMSRFSGALALEMRAFEVPRGGRLCLMVPCNAPLEPKQLMNLELVAEMDGSPITKIPSSIGASLIPKMLNRPFEYCQFDIVAVGRYRFRWRGAPLDARWRVHLNLKEGLASGMKLISILSTAIRINMMIGSIILTIALLAS